MASEVRAKMELATVYQTSYRPLPTSVHCLSPPVVVIPDVAFETVTVHRDTYRPKDASDPIKSCPPRDHNFLAGDGCNRFHCTMYKTDYPAKAGRPAQMNFSKAPVPPPLHVPVQSDTTTKSTYRQPEMRPIWRYPGTVYKLPPISMETLSVQRASYKPMISKADVESETDNYCAGPKVCGVRPSVVVDLCRATVPVDICTTYTKSYGHLDCKRLKTIPEKSLGTTEDAPRAHEY